MTDLNKNVRVRYTDEGADKVRKNMKDVGKDADDLSKKEITPKLTIKGITDARKDIKSITDDGEKFGKKDFAATISANAERGKRNIADFNKDLDKLDRRKVNADVGIRGTQEGEVALRKFGDQVKKFGELSAKARTGLEGNDKAELALDRLAHKAKMFGKMVERADVKLEGVEKDTLEMRALNLQLDEFNRKSAKASVETKKRGTFGNFAGALGGDAISKALSGGIGGIGNASGGFAQDGEEAGNAFTGAFGQQVKVGLIAAFVILAASVTPAVVPLAIGLGVGFGGAFIAALTHKGLKDKVTSTFQGIFKDIGKDTTPMVKPLEQMLTQLGGFVKSESGPLRDMFKASLPFLRMFVSVGEQFAKELIPAMTMAMKQLTPEMPLVRKALAALLSGFVLFIKALGPGIKPAISIFLGFMEALKFILPAVAGLCDALAIAWRVGFVEMKIVITAFINVVRSVWVILRDLFTGKFGKIAGDLAKIWHGLWQELLGLLKDFWNAIKGPLNDIWHFAVKIFDNVRTSVKNIWNDIWNYCRNRVKDFVTTVTGIWTSISRFATRTFNDIENAVKRAWDDTWDWAKKRVKQFSSDVASIWDNIFSFVKHIFGDIENAVKRIWDDVWNWAKKRLKDFSSDVASIWDNIFSFAKSVFNKIEHGIKSIWDDLWNWAKRRLKDFSSDVASIWDGIASFAKHVFGVIESDVKRAWNDLWAWAKARVKTFSSDIASIWDGIASFASRTFNRIKTTVERIWNTFWGNLKHDGASAVNWIVNNVLNPLGGIWNKVVSALGLPKSIKFPKIPTIGGKQDGGLIGAMGDNSPKMASGGMIPGQNRGDTHHIMAESGEVVVPRRVVPKYAMSFKADGIPGMQNGGLIGGIPAYVNGGNVPGTGSPSGGGPGKDQGITGKAGSIGASGNPSQNPLATKGKNILKTEGNFSISGMIKDLKNDAIDLAFKPITSIIDAGIHEVQTLGGFGELVGDAAQKLLAAIINKMESSAASVESGGATGNQIATYAKKFVGHRYVLGGSGDYQTKHDPPFGPWDCAGFVSQMYDHFGLGSPTAGINVTALRNWSHNKKDKKPTVGGMAFFAGADGTNTHPGHVGMVTGPNQSIQAMDEALGTRMASLQGALWYATPPGGFGTGGPGGFSGTGGTAVYTYLLNNVFDGHKIAAAGATASIWGESGWNPESVGTGGNGLIGWTPPRPGIVTGNKQRDLDKQLPMIKQFISQSGDEGVIREMMGATSILQAANLWGKGVERYGINDVHSEGLTLAKQIMNSVSAGKDSVANTAKGKGTKGGGGSLANKKHLALGGMINEPVFGTGLRTGASYAIAENEPEYVTPMKNIGRRGGGGGNSYYFNIEAGVSSPADVGRTVIQCVTKYEQHQGKRGDALTF